MLVINHNMLCGAGGGYGEENYGNNRQRKPFRKEKEEKVQDSIIEERIQRERPCRTLFIRNIKASQLRIVHGHIPLSANFIPFSHSLCRA